MIALSFLFVWRKIVEIKDIVEQEKHKRTLAKIKKREEAVTRKRFLKDCYKFWKEYKKVESPYFWWLDILLLPLDTHYLSWIRCDAPKNYVENSWFSKKWETKWIIGVGYNFRRKSDPSNTFYWVY